MQALHFGAGNIGRGFIGKLLVDSEVDVTFTDINENLINLINQKEGYFVKIVGNNQNDIEYVRGIKAFNTVNEEILFSKISQVDLITTAVGVSVLPIIAKSLAKGIIIRLKEGNFRPLNIIACENMIKATSELKKFIFEYLSLEEQILVEKYVGFVDSVVDRIVPIIEPSQEDPLLVVVEDFCEWIVDKTQFKGNIPKIIGMECTDNLMAFIERKLFTLNTGHSVTAYLGKLQGYQNIKSAIDNEEIRFQVKQVMKESGNVLIKRYGFNLDYHLAYIDKILERFANPYLQDDIDRVAREPLRKLGYNERLIKPLRGTLEYGLPNTMLCKSIALVLHYINPKDRQSVELQDSILKKGVCATLVHYTGLLDKSLIDNIAKIYVELAH